MIRSYFKVIGTTVFEVVEYLSTGKIVERELDQHGVPVDVVIIKEGKS